jgi:signal transduction histidine kinase/DNA-binding response OmpR family regulator
MVSRTGFRGRLVAALLGACAAPYVARASAGEPGDSVVVDDAFEERALGASLALFEDETAAMTLDDVRTPAIAQRFVPARVESPSLGYTASTWWARFTIDDRRTPGSAAAEEPLVVTLAYAQTDEARLACTNEEGAVVVRARAGDHVPHEELPSAYREPSFEIPRTARTCWIDVHTTGSVQFPVTLRSFDRFVEHRVEDTKLQFLYFGALLVMIAYNALVALAAGSRAYAAYTSFLVAHGLVQVLLAGVTPRWLAALVSPADRLIPLATSLTGLTSLVFTMILLDVRARTPRLAAIAKVLGIYLASHAALSLFMPYHVGVKAALVVEPFWAALLVAIGVVRAVDRERVAFYYLGAWAAFIVGAIVYLARVTGIVPTTALTANAQQLGSAVEFVLLSFALADRIKTLQEESQRNAERAREASEVARQATELALAEQSRLNLELQRIDKLKDSFLANTSHELRTPLNGILGLVETTLNGAVGDVGPLVKRNLKLVRASGRRLATLVNDILDFSALREQTVRLHARPVGLASMVELALQTLAPLASDKHVFLANEVSEHIGVVADENRLQQILTNLIGNAIKFTTEGEITLRAQIIGPRVHVSVHDTGVGIAPEDRVRIFDSFQQGDGSTTREFGGTGLGLAVTKRLVEIHGGVLRVESELGVGSVFTFDLAVCDVPAEEEAPTSHIVPQGIVSPSSFSISGAVLAAVPPSNGIRVLVADDEPVNREMLAQHLMAQGFTVIQATDGVSALAAIRGERPDLVLLDVMMPRKNGYEVLAEVRPELAATELPVLLLTAKAQESDLKRGFLLGASDYVLKPVSFVELDARIAHHTRLVRAQRELREHAVALEGRVEQRTTELRAALDAIAVDLEEAKLFQQIALKTPPSLAGLDLAVRWVPLGVVSGDFYDFCELPDGRLRVLVADATGHGVQAALRTMVIKTAYDAIKTTAETPADCLRALNAALLAAYPSLEAKTDAVCVDVVRVEGGGARITVSIAGVMYVLFDDGEARGEVQAPGFSLGYLEDLPFVNASRALGPEARVCLFSDGLTEQFDERETPFDFAPLESSLAARGTPEDVADRIMAAWHLHRAEVAPADDVTLVVIGLSRASSL